MTIRVKFTEHQEKLNAHFDEQTSKFDAKFGEVKVVTEYVGGEKYNGEYIVTPKTSWQSLPTKDKVLVDDVTIKEIPFYEVSNSSGGNTIYIGDKI